LRINIAEGLSGRERDGLFQIFRRIAVHEWTQLMVWQFAPPAPAFALGAVMLQVTQDLAQIEFLVCR
jgi:hypothetical protein